MSDLVERAKQMPSSLNDACRTIELMSEEIKRLTERLATAESTIDALESNAGVQAKLLADTGRDRDELRRQLASARAAAAIGRCYVEACRNAAMVRRDYAKTEKHEAELKQIDAALTDETGKP